MNDENQELNIKELLDNPRTKFQAMELERLEKLEEEAKELLEDEEMREMAQDDLDDLEKQKEEVKKQILEILEKEKEEEEFPNEMVLEIRAGAGGDDAKDFCRMLFEMYQRFFKKVNWPYEVLKTNWQEFSSKTKARLLSEATLLVKKEYAYGYLKDEKGVHRLVRKSPFSAKNLRHTSFVYVEVLPYFEELKTSEIKLSPEDLEIQTFRASGPGGQYVNRRETAVRIKYKPLNIVVECQSQRSQAQNKELALRILKSKILKLLEEKQKKEIKELKGKIKIEWGHQIRSYILDPYHLVKDHRKKIELSEVKEVLEGNLMPFIEI